MEEDDIEGHPANERAWLRALHHVGFWASAAVSAFVALLTPAADRLFGDALDRHGIVKDALVAIGAVVLCWLLTIPFMLRAQRNEARTTLRREREKPERRTLKKLEGIVLKEGVTAADLLNQLYARLVSGIDDWNNEFYGIVTGALGYDAATHWCGRAQLRTLWVDEGVVRPRQVPSAGGMRLQMLFLTDLGELVIQAYRSKRPAQAAESAGR